WRTPAMIPVNRRRHRPMSSMGSLRPADLHETGRHTAASPSRHS
ncbi:MAG: hypothetical protein AVDCRST_MAG88-3097, partial [uncultured Thermomicrobiales bacterium]